MKQKKETLIFVLYDGIKNSVFEGQVLAPLLKKENKNIAIISFEYKPISRDPEEHLKIITLKKYPFLGKFVLISAIAQLKKVLKKYDNYAVIARGPIAGYICAKAINFNACSSFTIQARGLIAQEYQYAHKDHKNILLRFIHKIRYHQYKALEATAYKQNTALPNTTIEAVSNALKTYIVAQFGVNEKNITIAKHDIPQTIDKNLITHWRHKIRTQLQIPFTHTVYCYNGSVKPWQCPDKVIDFFENKLKKDENSFLLILTQDKNQFEKILKQSTIDQKNYVLKTVAHTDIYKYLAACDCGIIFRENNIINWVSRPTKILEYQSVGLKIIHNNTIEILQDVT